MKSNQANNQWMILLTKQQVLRCYEGDVLCNEYAVSTGKNGLGEQSGSGCTPRGWHRIHDIIGEGHALNSVFVARCFTGEVYNASLAKQFPERDWILTRILTLDGLEPGRNQGGDVDSLKRFIYIHGTPDTSVLGIPQSHGCVRMRNEDILLLAKWTIIGTRVCIL